MKIQPIGVLDSGVGGLTVLREIHQQLPQESTIYIGDSQHAPYGKRTPEEIRCLAGQMINFLLKKQAKLIVIACNTITVNGIDSIREAFSQVPIVGTVPVIKMAAKVTKKKKIGVLVTEATAKSSYNARLIRDFAADCAVTLVGTNKLVPLIESENNSLLPATIAQELDPFKKNGVDVVVLGSTHFPILRKQIGDFLGTDVVLLDSGGAVARQVGRILTHNNTLSTETGITHEIYTTGPLEPFAKVADMVLGKGFTPQQTKLDSISKI